jgi:hypothetical protein
MIKVWDYFYCLNGVKVMARESASFMGSGIQTIRYTNLQAGLPVFLGSNVVLVNPEDVDTLLGIPQQTNVSVTTTATELIPNKLAARRKVLLTNTSGEVVYIGDSSVTINDGYPLTSGVALELNLISSDRESLYGIVAAGTADIRVLQLA